MEDYTDSATEDDVFEDREDILPPSTTWIVRLSGEWYDGGGLLLDEHDGSFLVLGLTKISTGFADRDAWLLKIDLQGHVIRQKALGNDNDYVFANRMVRLTNDVIIAFGEITIGIDPYQDMWVFKLGESGDILWQKALGRFESSDSAGDIAATMDGGFVVAGGHYLPEIGEYVTAIIKLDADGNILWQRGYDDGTVNEVWSIIETGAGELLATGFIGPDGGGKDLWFMKLDAEGSILWEERIGPVRDAGNILESSMVTMVIESRTGGFLVSAITESYGQGMDDMWILKLDEDGGIVWQKTLGDRYDDAAGSILETSDGGIVWSGSSVPAENSRDMGDAVIVKLDADGNLLWQKTISYRFVDDPSIWGEGAGVEMETADGGLLFTGTVGCTPENYDLCDLWVGKLTAEAEVDGGCDLIREGTLVIQDSEALVFDNSSDVLEVTIPERPADATMTDTSAVPEIICQGI